MTISFKLQALTHAQACTQQAAALLVLLPKTDGAASHKSDKTDKKSKATASDPLSRLIAQARAAGDFEGHAAQVLAAYRIEGIQAAHIVLAGVGEGSAKDMAKQVGKAVAAALAAFKPAKGAKDLHLVLDLGALPALDEQALQAAVQTLAASSYRYTTTKSKAEPSAITQVTLGVAQTKGLSAAFAQAQALVMGVEFAKEWANRPANHATPSMLAKAAQSIAQPVQCEVLGPKEVAKLGMGSFMAVAQGSDEPLRFIVLRYEGAAKSKAPTVLVGKGITFDTGGISIKPAGEMDEMKFDMGGAASVLGVFKTLSLLKPKINVVGLIPTCENMPSGRAVKPGDVVTSMSGQTIEILNTDAEGRLILCDALTYAERFNPKAVIDIATLTGACVIALGHLRSGLFASHDGLAADLQSAGDAALDPCWRMPLDDEYGEGLKTNFADVANIGGRAGGSITAAKFLQRFASKYPWAHLDIAGTAWKSGAAKGATGRPVPLLMAYLLKS
jgi:leucyl aminopeptidase